MTTPIPQPPAIPFLGNVNTLDREVPVRSFLLLAKTYGEAYKLVILGTELICVNTVALTNEVSDDRRFIKAVPTSLMQVRNLAGDGLFTALHGEPNWELAHRLLIPAFGTVPIRGMFDDMRDICNQMLLKWERFGPEAIIDPVADYTRVALDTIALCSMSYRLNSFYSETPPPFVDAMVDFLKECFARSRRPTIVQAMMPGTTAKYEQDQKIMVDLAAKIISDRKAHPTPAKHDLLDIMLNSKDPKTGQGLPDDNIGRNLLTFLIAGHETSSGMMSFTTYYLLKHPETMRKLRHEIDTVLEGRPAQYQDLSRMPYLTAVMRESMRLAPTAPARAVEAVEDTTIGGGKYFIKKGMMIVIQSMVMQRDPAVWGEDAEEFRPERMLEENFKALPPNAWQPFGYGSRGCIGRPFAWQEITLVLASVIQKFDLSLVDPSYTLDLQQALTIKPKGLFIRATPRANHPALSATLTPVNTHPGKGTAGAAPIDLKVPLYVLYGSNTGTSEALAQRLVNEAAAHGFAARIGTLDSATEHLPIDGPVIIVTASFEGQPADNAVGFVDWLTSLQGQELSGVRFAVFGCGNSDWVQTYQRIPILCDEILEQRGGKRLVPRGSGDVSLGTFFGVFDEFEATVWSTLSKEYSTKQNTSAVGFEVKTVDPGTERSTNLRQAEAAFGEVVVNKVLTKPGAPSKIHLEFKLPEGVTYNAGDYLAILPHNPPKDVRRVLSYFGLSEDHHIIVTSDGPTSLPVGKPVTVFEIFRGYVELSQPATSRDLAMLLDNTSDDATRSALQALKNGYELEVLTKRISVLDILEEHRDTLKLPLSVFLRMLPPMRVRQYSISSSPLWNPEHATLTISVLEAPSLSRDSKIFMGVASTYLAQLTPGDRLQMSVRPSAVAFHPPEDPAIPMVMFCAGSGLAPMRGFIQERAMQKASGREVGKILLFFGCRSPDADFLYADNELAEWEKLGVLEVRPAFSRATEHSNGCKYVQDRVWHDREDIQQAYENHAKFFTCGSGKIAKGVKSKLVEIIQSSLGGIDYELAAEKLEKITNGRYATDIFD